MGCFTDELYDLNSLNECRTVVPGIRRLMVAAYRSDLFKSLTILNQQITAINIPITFIELVVNDKACKYTQKYNYSTKKYEQTLELDISIFDTAKNRAIDSLLKSKLVFLVQDRNSKWLMVGEKYGINSIDNNSGLDNSNYQIKYFGGSEYSNLGVSDQAILDMTADCSDLDNQNTGSIFFWGKYKDCIIPLD